MVGDVQDMTADYKGGVLAAGTDYHAAINGRQRGVAGNAGRVATLDQNGAQQAIALGGLSAAATFPGLAWRTIKLHESAYHPERSRSLIATVASAAAHPWFNVSPTLFASKMSEDLGSNPPQFVGSNSIFAVREWWMQAGKLP
jgi:hypothetical protein